MIEIKFNAGLEEYRRENRLTQDEIAAQFDLEWTGEQYKRYILENRVETVKVAKGCALRNKPFPKVVQIIDGSARAKIKAEIVDSKLGTVRAALRRVFKFKPDAEEKWLRRGRAFLDNGHDAFWYCVFYEALRWPCISWRELVDSYELEEINGDLLIKDERQTELPV